MVPGRQPVGLSEDLLFWALVASGWLVPSSGPESRSRPIQRLWAGVGGASGSAPLGLWVRQLPSASGGHPPEVSGLGALPGFQLWAASRGFRCGPPLR